MDFNVLVAFIWLHSGDLDKSLTFFDASNFINGSAQTFTFK